ncbi:MULTISPECIES: EF-hand domain-containing protein [unclassified Caballeronia]|uniref:EF-hand domain-containing protein n=1 Tax=unclassified Caballeronia TaxID=2646786 RepID=UPI002859376D|nr:MULTISPECIES: EF-hand domain-containing protein [unclassified Caballeronia]MDR5739584.1 EF-hand domain-containing protein [Caballeronia sp. LZ016]MDR5808051.1 EF-hand domain-containing protein [Caballeronia sp. LZ019]
MHKIAAVLAFCAALVAGAAHAQTATQPMGASPHIGQAAQVMPKLRTRFAQANTTHDGKLTRDQAATGMPMVARHFDEIDAQKNGYVTLPQIEVFLREHAAQR